MESLTLMPALPEIFLAVIGMVLLMFGVFQGDASRHWMTWAVVASLVVAGVLVPQAADGRSLAFGGLFVTDAFAVFRVLSDGTVNQAIVNDRCGDDVIPCSTAAQNPLRLFRVGVELPPQLGVSFAITFRIETVQPAVSAGEQRLRASIDDCKGG